MSFRIFGIPVTVHWSFWITMALLGGVVGATGPEAWSKIVLFAAAGFISILIHELGHGLSAAKFGAHSIRIQLYALGGLCYFANHGMSRRQDFLVSAAGPAAGYALGLLTLVLARQLLPADAPPMVHHFVIVMVFINLFWSTANLLPVLPLDGGQMLRAALGPRRLRATLIISIITAALLIPVGIRLGFIILPIVGAFLAWQSIKELQSLGR